MGIAITHGLQNAPPETSEPKTRTPTGWRFVPQSAAPRDVPIQPDWDLVTATVLASYQNSIERGAVNRRIDLQLRLQF